MGCQKCHGSHYGTMPLYTAASTSRKTIRELLLQLYVADNAPVKWIKAAVLS